MKQKKKDKMYNTGASNQTSVNSNSTVQSHLAGNEQLVGSMSTSSDGTQLGADTHQPPVSHHSHHMMQPRGTQQSLEVGASPATNPPAGNAAMSAASGNQIDNSGDMNSHLHVHLQQTHHVNGTQPSNGPGNLNGLNNNTNNNNNSQRGTQNISLASQHPSMASNNSLDHPGCHEPII